MIKPHGKSALVNRFNPNKDTSSLNSIVIEDRYINDCEMIGIGAYSPLSGFMTQEETNSVIENMRLPDNTLWPIPITLPVEDNVAKQLKEGQEIVIKSKDNEEIATMEISEIFRLENKTRYCEKVFNTSDINHPGVKVIMNAPNNFLAGKITLLKTPRRKEISESYYLTPEETRIEFEKRGWKTIVAFQTRNPIHRAHEYIQKCAQEFVDGLLIHPIVGETKEDDIPANVRMKCYDVLVNKYYSTKNTMVSVMPAAMRYAGPKEAILHAIIRQNYGCTHFIIGRDHAGVGNYYGTYEAQEALLAVKSQLEITPLPFEHAFFCQKCGNVTSQKTCPHDSSYYIHLSGTQVRKMLSEGQRPPLEFTREEIADILIDWATKKKN